MNKSKNLLSSGVKNNNIDRQKTIDVMTINDLLSFTFFIGGLIAIAASTAAFIADIAADNAVTAGRGRLYIHDRRTGAGGSCPNLGSCPARRACIGAGNGSADTNAWSGRACQLSHASVASRRNSYGFSAFIPQNNSRAYARMEDNIAVKHFVDPDLDPLVSGLFLNPAGYAYNSEIIRENKGRSRAYKNCQKNHLFHINTSY
jgi:hypothetical protein